MYADISFVYQLSLDNVEDRVERSIRFGEDPTSENAKQLINDGVDYFVFDLRRGLLPAKMDDVNVLYEDDIVRLVNLNDFVDLTK